MPPETVTPDPLDALAAAADEAAAGPASPAAPGAAPEAPPPDPAAEVYGALDLVRLAVVQLKPSLRDAWSDANLRAIANAAPAVMAKHGWTVGGLFEKWGPEIALAAACAPLAIGTARVLRAEADAKAAAAARPAVAHQVPAAAPPRAAAPAEPAPLVESSAAFVPV